MSKIRKAIEDLKDLGWSVDNESLRRLVLLRNKLKEEEEKKNEHSLKRSLAQQ